MKLGLGQVVITVLLLATGAQSGAAPVVTQFHGGPAHLGVFDGSSPGNLLRYGAVRMGLVDGKSRGITLEAPIFSPWIDSGVIYFATNDGVLYAMTSGPPLKRPPGTH